MAAQSSAVNVTATGVVSGIPCTYRGLSVFSTAGATVVLYDNASAASGTVLAKFTLAAGGRENVDVSDGLRCPAGIYLTATAGIEGHVRIG